jgi:hypothetical protein
VSRAKLIGVTFHASVTYAKLPNVATHIWSKAKKRGVFLFSADITVCSVQDLH